LEKKALVLLIALELEINRKIDNNRPLDIDIDSSAYCVNELLQMNVPLEYQDDDFSCTPVCMLMVLKHIKDRFTSGFPDLSLSAISEAVKTSADLGGTTFENIKNINELFKKTSPSLEIVPDFRRSFGEIIEEVKKNDLPVIAWVLMLDPNGPYEHAIVITDVDEEKLLIYCNDPVYGRQTIPTRRFMDMWNGCFRILIKFKIGEKVTLYDFPSQC
jgi:ABC-type bacteriocin/lantibiotic exporter with double-glycine peptidase domain